LYAAEWPCCHDPLRFSLGSDDLSPQRGNPTRRTPNACLLSLLSLASRAPAARPSPLGRCRVHGAPHGPPARGVRVCASRAHALTPFASLILSLFFSSAFRLLLKPFIFSTPLAGVAFSHFRRCDDSPGHAVRICASRTSRPLRPFAFIFERLSPVIFSTPLAGAAFSDFRRFPRTRSEGLCVMRTASHQRFAFLPFH
jgi:hypothetical protein